MRTKPDCENISFEAIFVPQSWNGRAGTRSYAVNYSSDCSQNGDSMNGFPLTILFLVIIQSVRWSPRCLAYSLAAAEVFSYPSELAVTNLLTRVFLIFLIQSFCS